MNPHQVTKDFEAAIADYTGAPYVVAVNSCTMALTLAVAWHLRHLRGKAGTTEWDHSLRNHPYPIRVEAAARPKIEIPKRTYVSVPMAIVHAGGHPGFRDEFWLGGYQLKPLPVWDCARWFTENIYKKAAWPAGCGMQYQSPGPAGMVCVSFHASKTLGIEQGGAILHDDPEADAWLRRARFDGRTEGVAPKDDKFTQIGWHCYMNPSTAAQGLLKIHSLPRDNAPLPNDDYPDLSTMEIFK